MDDQENFIKALVTYQDNNNYIETIYSDVEKILVSICSIEILFILQF